MKKLIIVVDRKTQTYGELLSTLIGMDGDCKNEIETEFWQEDEYKDKIAGVDPDSKIVFIGKSMLTVELAVEMNFKNTFSEYGVHYDSVGNQALVCTDSTKFLISQSKYDNFVDDYNAFLATNGLITEENAVEREDIPAELIKDQSIEATKSVGNVLGKGLKGLGEGLVKATEKKDELKEQAKEDKKNHELLGKAAKKTVSLTASAVKGVAKAAVSVAGGTINLTKDVLGSGKDVLDQQKRCAIIVFYAEGLKPFMGL